MSCPSHVDRLLAAAHASLDQAAAASDRDVSQGHIDDASRYLDRIGAILEPFRFLSEPTPALVITPDPPPVPLSLPPKETPP